MFYLSSTDIAPIVEAFVAFSNVLFVAMMSLTLSLITEVRAAPSKDLGTAWAKVKLSQSYRRN